MKIITYILVLLLGILFISASLPSRETQPTGSFTNANNNPSSVSHSGDKPEELVEEQSYGEALNIRNTTIFLDEPMDSVFAKLGNPNRVVATEYNFDFYVYNNDYRRLLFIAVKEDHIVGYYTDSEDFIFNGISSGISLSGLNRALNESYSIEELLTYQTDSYIATIFMDTAGSETVSGIYVLDHTVEIGEFTSAVMRSIEQLGFDLVNSIRARNGLPLLSWSSTAAKAARKHSSDMAEHDYFAHISPFAVTPGDRLRNEGQNYRSIAENIIAGYGTAVISSHAWYSSPEHRDNILNPEYTCVGIGFVYLPDSHYKSYMTQVFYR